MSKNFRFFLILSLFLPLLLFLFYYLYRAYRYAITEAIFVQADKMVYASFTKVNGRLIRLYKKEGDQVAEGELLAEIESEDYQAKLSALQETIGKIRMDKISLGREIMKISKNIPLRVEQIQVMIGKIEDEKQALSAELLALQARLQQIKRDRQRFENLFNAGLISQQNLELIKTQEEELHHQMEALRAKRETLSKEKAALERELQLALNEEETVKYLRAKLTSLTFQEKEILHQKEELNFYQRNTKLYSPSNGVVAKKFRSEGDVVSLGQPIYAIVDPKTFYVLVLLEENKLRGVVKGAAAKVWLDSFPEVPFEGEVEEVLPASAATFALVPRDISAGEFTKLAQRIPVRIKLRKGPFHILRVGLGGKVEIKRSTQ